MLVSLEDKHKSNLHKYGKEKELLKIIISLFQPEKYSKYHHWLRRCLCAWPVFKGDLGMAEAGEEDVQKEHLHGCISSDGCVKLQIWLQIAIQLKRPLRSWDLSGSHWAVRGEKPRQMLNVSENTQTAGGKKWTAIWFTAATSSNHHPPILQGRRGAGPAGREDLKWSCVTGGSPSPSGALGLSGRRKTKKKAHTCRLKGSLDYHRW